jgi:hypothetical protein
MDQLAQFKRDFITFAEESPAEAYVLSNRWKKIMEEIEEKTKPKGIDYWMNNKELPFWFSMRESKSRKAYAFDENAEWCDAKSKLVAIESRLKNASDAKVAWQCLMDEVTGEILPTVTITLWGAIYSIISK